MLKFYNAALFLIILFSCASSSNSDQLKIRELIANKNFPAALEALDKTELKKNQHDQMLYNMELGSLLFYEGKFSQAALKWQTALEIAAEQYTKISQVASSAVISDQMKDFRPKNYEISYLYYFQALAFYYEYLKNKDKNILLQARASVIAWDGYLKSIQIEQEYKDLYFDDYFARFFAGLIHETIGSRSDQEIALQLYKDAYQLFLLQGPSYSQFNPQANDYVSVLMKKLRSKEKWREELRSLALANQQLENAEFQKIRNFLGSKLLNLTKSLRSSEYKKLASSMNIKEVENGDVLILWHDGWMNPVKAKNIRLSLEAAAKDKSASQAVLTVIAQAGFLIFASKVLGASGSSNNSSTNVSINWYGTKDITDVIASAASLEFEVPDVDPPKIPSTHEVSISNAEGKELGKSSMTVMQSFDELVFQSVERSKAVDVFRKGTRFAAKQVGAMIGAYALYQSMVAKNSNNEGLAKLSAMATYFGAAKLINISEHADTRYWSILPSNIQMALFKTSKNDTNLVIKKPDGSTQEVQISPGNKTMQIIPLI